MDTVWMERRKYPDHPHYGHDGVRLGSDELGVWHALTPGRPVMRGDVQLFVSEGDGGITLVPHHDWWWASFFFNQQFDLYVDIATPSIITPTSVTTVDLDFDVLRRSDGTVVLLDEDEFEEHRIRYGYPEEMQVAARTAAAVVYRSVLAGEPPFASPAQRWVDLAVEAGCTAPR